MLGGLSYPVHFTRAFSASAFDLQQTRLWRARGLLSGVFARLFALLGPRDGILGFEEFISGVALFAKSNRSERLKLAFRFCATDTCTSASQPLTRESRLSLAELRSSVAMFDQLFNGIREDNRETDLFCKTVVLRTREARLRKTATTSTATTPAAATTAAAAPPVPEPDLSPVYVTVSLKRGAGQKPTPQSSASNTPTAEAAHAGGSAFVASTVSAPLLAAAPNASASTPTATATPTAQLTSLVDGLQTVTALADGLTPHTQIDTLVAEDPDRELHPGLSFEEFASCVVLHPNLVNFFRLDDISGS